MAPDSDRSAQGDVTALLLAAQSGDGRFDRLISLVYDELRDLAHVHLARERRAHTLNTTALVHEAYFKLVDQTQVSAKNRAYFFGAASRAMRQILVDHARHRNRLKRGGGERAHTLDEQQLVADDFAAEVIELDEALETLGRIEPRAARVVECRYFGGLSVDETAEALAVSPRTVMRDWTTARAWLYRTLRAETGDDDGT